MLKYFYFLHYELVIAKETETKNGNIWIANLVFAIFECTFLILT